MLAIMHGWMGQSKATRRAREGLLKQMQIQILSSIPNAKRSEDHMCTVHPTFNSVHPELFKFFFLSHLIKLDHCNSIHWQITDVPKWPNNVFFTDV